MKPEQSHPVICHQSSSSLCSHPPQTQTQLWKKLDPGFPCSRGTICPRLFRFQKIDFRREIPNMPVCHSRDAQDLPKKLPLCSCPDLIEVWDLSASLLSFSRGKGKICLWNDGNNQVWPVIVNKPPHMTSLVPSLSHADKGLLKTHKLRSLTRQKERFHCIFCGEKWF